MLWKWIKKWINKLFRKTKLVKEIYLSPVTRLSLSSNIFQLNRKHTQVTAQYLQELEVILIENDVELNIVKKILEKLWKITKQSDNFSLNQLTSELKKIMKDYYSTGLSLKSESNKLHNHPHIILLVGVNGSGKTTSIAKLAYWYQLQGKSIILIAGDTFRAAGSEQLALWSERLKINCVLPNKPFQDPASLVFEGIQRALTEEKDIIIIDTSGRMENNKNLMMQLQKINNVVFKLLNKKIDEKLFILDANTGQNGILQVKTFQEYIDLTGLILTKLDGSSKGGIIFSIKNKLNLPVKFIGTGEMVTDLQLFNIDTYLESFFAKEK